MKFSINDIKNSPCGHLNAHLFESLPGPKKEGGSKRKGHKIKDWLQLNLEYWCDGNKKKLTTEFMFDPERKWRFDWAIKKMKVAIEYEGLNSKKSRHTTKAGYTGDTEKYNEAAAQGWRVMRYTALNYKDLLKDLEKL